MDTHNKEVQMNPKKINEKENAFLDSLCKRTNGFFWNYCVRSNDAGDVLLTSYNTNEPYCRLDEVEYFDQRSFRGKEFFASMPPEQISATAALVKHLCRKYSIPLKFKNDETLFESDAAAREFAGIFTHANVRKDKFDWPMTKSMKSVVEACMSD